jgi:hypothetical protein
LAAQRPTTMGAKFDPYFNLSAAVRAERVGWAEGGFCRSNCASLEGMVWPGRTNFTPALTCASQFWAQIGTRWLGR